MTRHVCKDGEYGVGEFAQMVGADRHTLQHWDKQGKLVAHRDEKNQRYYTDEHVSLVAFATIDRYDNCNEIDGEIWKDVPGFSGYQASNFGRMRSLRRAMYYYGEIIEQGQVEAKWLLLKQKVKRGGYLCASMTNDEGKQRTMRIHRVILMTFDRLPTRGELACHKDDNRINNHIENLKWGSIQDNADDSARNNSHKGYKAGRAKLTEKTVIEIRKLYRTGSYTQKQLGKIYGVNHRTVNYAINGRNWWYVTEEG